MAQRTLSSLLTVLTNASRQYWETGVSFLSDTEYDRLVEELRQQDPGNPFLQKIESPVALEGKVQHPVPMLSLAKAYTQQEVLKWTGDMAKVAGNHFQVLVMPKYDGIAGRWDGTILATRGNGHVGENITLKKRIIRVPSRDEPGKFLPLDNFPPFLGEILMAVPVFKKFQQVALSFGIEYKTIRNATAGLLNAKEIPSELLAAMQEQNLFLHMIPYSYREESMVMDLLGKAEIFQRHVKAVEKFRETEYPCDGVVFRVLNTVDFNKAGFTEHHPKGAIAFKFQNTSATTILRWVEWSVGKECITPVANFEPVTIGGVTISKATLHNMKTVLDMDLHIGDQLTIERAGDVIPYVAGSTPGEEHGTIEIKKCPVCGAPVVYQEPEAVCTNEVCPGKLVQCLLATARVFEVDSLAERTIQKLVDAGYGNWLDILNMTKEDWLQIPGFADVSAENMVKELKKSTNTTPEAVLASLNIRGVGKAMAKLILSKVSLYELPDTRSTTLQGIPGIGPERAKAVEQYFGLQTHRAYFRHLCEMLTIKYSAPMTEKTICFTGKMDQPRSYYEALAKEKGYTPVDSVTKSLTVLVTSDMASTSTKMKKAESLGIPVKSLDTWLNE